MMNEWLNVFLQVSTAKEPEVPSIVDAQAVLCEGLPSFEVHPEGLTGLDLLNHLIKKRMRESTLDKNQLAHLGIDISHNQKRVLEPTPQVSHRIFLFFAVDLPNV